MVSSGANPGNPGDQPSFGEQLNHLFATKLKTENGRKRRYTLREVADSTGISIGFLSEARRGRKDNPPKEFIELLARFFEVPPSYFFNPLPEESVAIQTAFREALTQPSMANILLRAGAYSEVEREMLLELMDSVERLRNIVDESKEERPRQQ